MRFLFRWIFRLVVCLLVIILLAGLLFGKKDLRAEQLVQKYGQPPSQFMNLMGMRVHYRDEGNRKDTVPLVLIHGTSSSLFTWDSTVLLPGRYAALSVLTCRVLPSRAHIHKGITAWICIPAL